MEEFIMNFEDDRQKITIRTLDDQQKKWTQSTEDGDYQSVLIARGNAYLKQKDYPKAIQCFEKVSQWETIADIYLTLGQEQKYHFYFAKYLQSERLLKEAADSFYKAHAYVKAAQLFEKLNDFKSAIKAYVEGDQINDAGEMLIRIGQPDKAARLYEKAGIFSQAAFYYRSVEKWVDLIRVYDLAKQYVDAIKVCLQQDQLASAFLYLQKIDKSHEDYLKAHVYLFVYLIEQKKQELLVSMFYDMMYDKDITLHNKGLLTLAELFEKNKLHHEALHTYRRIVNLGQALPHVRQRLEALEEKLQYIEKKAELRSYTDRFLLYRLLGQGAMSRVYKAQDSHTHQWVALKTLSRDQEDTEHLQAFFQEASTSSYLNHPNIVRILDYGIENDHLFIAMEYLEGKTLQYALKQMGKINLSDFLAITSQLCKALMYAHDMQVIHRDIKPSNIMLLKEKRVKLMDFGIAKLTDLSNHISIQRGTPKYTSPEQILGIQTTQVSDIYSLGVVMFEMLAGQPPFEGETALHDHVNKTPTPLDQFVQGIPYVLVNVIMSSLAKKAERRPQSAEKILDVIESIGLTEYEETTEERLMV